MLSRGAGALALVIAAIAVSLMPSQAGATALPVGTITKSALPTPEAEPSSIAAGADGNLWFTNFKANSIGRITPGGEIAAFAIPTEKGRPEGITAGPDGDVWFAERIGNKIGKITPAGEITEFSLLSGGEGPGSIVTGPDRNLWFTEDKGNRVGRITPAGQITEFLVPTAESKPMRISAGAGGDLWFTEYAGEKIGRITPSGEITEFPLPDSHGGPWGVAPGAEGDMWFTEFSGNRIGRITPTGEIAEFPLPEENSFPEAIAPGPDGNMWFVEYKGNKIGRITPTGEISEFAITSPESRPAGLAAGSDGQMWFAEVKANAIGRVATGSSQALLAPPKVSGNAQAGSTQTCRPGGWSTWSALQPSSSLFSFDGYWWWQDGSMIAAGQSFAPTSAEVGKQISCSETVTYQLQGVSVSATSSPVNVIAPLPPPPKISGLRQSAGTWREGNALAYAGKAANPPVGTRFSFSLNERANVKLVFGARVPGHRSGGRCLRGAPRGKGGHCEREQVAGNLSFVGASGANAFSFQGRISRSKRLRPGRYTLKLTATASKRSSLASLRFKIVE